MSERPENNSPAPLPQISPDQARQIAEAKLAKNFQDVFGKPPGPGETESRSAAQIAVWAQLAAWGYDDKPTFIPDRNGAFCPVRGALTDGRRALWLDIKRTTLFQPQIQK